MAIRHQFTEKITVNGWSNVLTAIKAAGYDGPENPTGETTILNFNAGVAYLHFSDDASTDPNFGGTAQVETTAIVAAAGITGDGDLVITVTGADITGSPLDVTVTGLTTGAHTTATLIATEVRTALDAETAISDVYTIGGTGANITLTQIIKNGNDGTLNIDINADDGGSTSTGVTNDATSDNTTAGVAAGTEGLLLSNDSASAPSSAFTVKAGMHLGAVWLYTASSLDITVSVANL